MIVRKVKVTEIEYDIDEGQDAEELPKELILDIEYEDYDILEDLVSDEISCVTGFCHLGFQMEEIEANNL